MKCCDKLKRLIYWVEWGNIWDTDEFNYCPFDGKKIEDKS